MVEGGGRFARVLLDRWAGLRRRSKLALAGAAALFVTVMAVAGYRGYQYVEHDNTFCTTCHLMDDAFDRFQQSAHSSLGCHDCHKSTRADQIYQLYATIFKRPSEVEKHAHVPNEICGACHIQGDPVRWRLIASTAGHRVHLESRDSSLHNLQCVTCHSVSVHEFAPVDQTCGKSGCHTDTRIRLGKMGQLEIHCATCHTFLVEAPGLSVDSLGRPLTPQAQQCLNCHEMQARVGQLEIALDPHRGTCGDCHNPHTQETSREIGCTSSNCHADWREDRFHVGVARADQCMRCHAPHSWRVEGENCTRCHQEILRERPSRRAGAVRASISHENDVASLGAHDVAPMQRGMPAQPQQQRQLPVSHADHRSEPCASCHNSAVRHGAVTVRTEADCQTCHHVGPPRWVRAGNQVDRQRCEACHRAEALRRPSAPAPRTFTLVAGRASVTRSIRFDHQQHGEVACATCHLDRRTRSADRADCASCHSQHHQANANCLACHSGANALRSHTLADHQGCSGASCHGQRAARLPSSREACLVCHEDQVNHEPGQSCATCHRVGAPVAR